MMEPLIFLMLGLVGLWLGSQLAVTGYENVARRFGRSHLFIGLTVVAVGTLGTAFVGIVLVGL